MTTARPLWGIVTSSVRDRTAPSAAVRLLDALTRPVEPVALAAAHRNKQINHRGQT